MKMVAQQLKFVNRFLDLGTATDKIMLGLYVGSVVTFISVVITHM